MARSSSSDRAIEAADPRSCLPRLHHGQSQESLCDTGHAPTQLPSVSLSHPVFQGMIPCPDHVGKLRQHVEVLENFTTPLLRLLLLSLVKRPVAVEAPWNSQDQQIAIGSEGVPEQVSWCSTTRVHNERRQPRPRHSHPEASQSRVREAAMSALRLFSLPRHRQADLFPTACTVRPT